MLKDAGLVFNGNGECKAIAMYSHSGEKDQVKNSDFMELMLESNRHQELIHEKFYCIICHLQFDKDVVFNIHNGIVYKIRKTNGKKKQPDCFKKIQFDCNLCGKRCQSKAKYNEHFNLQHSAKVIRKNANLQK